MIRVVAVCDGGARGKGGMSSVLANQIAYFAQHVPDVRIQTLDPYREGKNLRSALHFAAQFLHLWRHRHEADIIHIHTAAYGSFVRASLLSLAAGGAGAALVFHVHASEMRKFFDRAGPLTRHLVRRVLGRSARVIVLGEIWRQYLSQQVGIPSAIIDVVYNGVGTSPDMAGQARDEVPLVLFLGHLGERKGVGTLIEALASPAMAGLGWHAILAGNGDVEGTRTRLRQLGLDTRVETPGWCDRDTIRHILARARILCLPSRDEGQPMAILEAMAHSLAIVTTPVGAIPETVEHERSALLVPVGDAAALGAAIARCVSDPGLCQRLGDAAHADYLKAFSLAAFGRKIETLYRHLAGRNRRNG